MRLIKILGVFIFMAMISPLFAFSEEPSWLDISGDYQGRFDSLKGTVHEYFSFQDVLRSMLGGPAPALISEHDVQNDTLMTNRFRLGVKAKATENVQVKARLTMYKVWGSQTSDAVTVAGGPQTGFFADRSDVFDGTVSHIPQDSALRVDNAYATWSNVFGSPVWFSLGRRPSTGGVPTNIRRNEEKLGTAGLMGLLIDYAFDGGTIGVAPYIEALPGAYAKFCYGRGFETGFKTNRPGDNTPKDTDFIGINVVPYDGEVVHFELQYVRAFNIFDNMPDHGVRTNLGDIEELGGLLMGTAAGFNLFASAAASKTHPNSNLFQVDTNGDGVPDTGVAGLLYDAPSFGGEKKSHTGYSLYAGGRYDINRTGTKIGAEYNYGSKYWITFAPAAEDMWTSKLGSRGSVYEAYIIQEIADRPVSKYGKAFFRLGYQYYKFDYTNSNSWLGAPKKMNDLDNPANAQMLPPIKNAQDIYLTFNVTF